MPTQYVKDEVFGPLAKRLKKLDVDKLIKQSIDIATDEGREILRQEMLAEGAPEFLQEEIRILRSPQYEGAVGLPSSHRRVEDLLDWEFGSVSGTIAPHGTLRFVADDMADIATAELALRVGQAFA